MPEKDKLVSHCCLLIDIGEFSPLVTLQKFLCSVPEQVWRQKAQYLQHKQNKAEATTVKHKTVSESKTKGVLDFKVQ